MNCCSLLVFLGDGKGGFHEFSKLLVPNLIPTQLFASDLNGDGYADLVSAAYPAVQILLNDGKGNFHLESITYYPSSLTFMLVQMGDINNDGKIDFVSLSSGSPSTFSMFLNTTK